jgi:hypothetical protein
LLGWHLMDKPGQDLFGKQQLFAWRQLLDLL